MRRRQTLGALGPSQMNQRLSLGPASLAAGKKESRLSMMPAGPRAAGRPSLAPSRKSSIGPGGRRSSYGVAPAAIKQDPRPIRDQDYKNKEIEDIIRYFVAKNYTGPISKKSFVSPSQKDFMHWFTFLFHQIDPEYKFAEKSDADVIPLLKRIGYPFVVNKSVLAAVGAGTAWPTLLAVLHWMVQLLQYFEAVESSEMTIVDPQKLFLEYIKKAYSDFMQGVDKPEAEVERELESLLAERNNGVLAEIQRAEIEVNAHTATLEELKRAESRLPTLQHTRNTLASDLTRFRDAIEKLVQYNTGLMAKHDEKALELAEKEREYKQLLAEKESVRKVLDAQPLRPEDVDRMHQERDRLAADIRALADRREAATRLVSERELAVAKRTDSLEARLTAYNTTVTRLVEAAAPPGQAANACAFTIGVNLHENEASAMVTTSISGVIVPALCQLKASITQQARTAQADYVSTAEALDRVEEALAEREEEVAKLDAKLKKLDGEFKADKETLQQRLEALRQQTEDAEAAVQALRQAAAIDVQASDDKVRASEETYKTVKEQTREEKEALIQTMLQTLDRLATHKTHIEETLCDVQQKWAETYAQVARAK